MPVNKYDPNKRTGIGSVRSPWVADFRVLGGARKRKAFRLRKDAEAWLVEQQANISSGSYVDPRRAQQTQVGALYESWMERLESMGARGKKPIAPSTADNYRKNWTKHIAPRWEHTPLANVHHRDVAKWIATMEVGSANQSGANTRRRVALMFGRLMNHAVYLELLPRNPAKDATGNADYVPSVKVEKQHVYMTMPELQAFARRCVGWEDMIMLAGTTGLRWGEISALKRSDIVATTQQVRRNSKARREAKGEFKEVNTYSIDVVRAWSSDGSRLIESTTKNGERRTVPVPSKVADMVLSARHDDGLLFHARNDNVLHHSNFTARVIKKAGADMSTPPTFHDLRHTAVSLILAQTHNVKLAQRIAGHKDATMTLNTYAELFAGDLHSASDALNNSIE
ncbi:tyrosine-type recombinase/integrase [Arthrobacter cryoconiti]|uniref:Tyrosine-type recombinase/integrase n=1 Tax=Arthrobacter cryoconiti TaxID=748907 RepID=A0ABV8QZU3_9MICC|nr:site-specific integrase [Arthrobacter cryoconiti]MCC9068569.1 site-specific integrase [Arthrobacter cryoconiti]